MRDAAVWRALDPCGELQASHMHLHLVLECVMSECCERIGEAQQVRIN